MSKLSAIISNLFASKGGLTTTQMRMGNETGQIQGLRLVKSIPFFGSKPFKDQYRILLTLLVPVALASVGTVIYAGIENNFTAQRVERATQLQMLSQRSARLASQLSNGDAGAAPLLAETLTQTKINLSALKDGTSTLTASSGEAVPRLDQVIQQWNTSEPRIQKLLDSTQTLRDVKAQNAFIGDSSSAALALMDKIRVLQWDQNSPLSNTTLVDSLTSTLMEIRRITQTLETAVLIPEDAPSQLLQTSKIAGDTASKLLTGDAALGVEATTEASNRTLVESVQTLVRVVSSDMAKFVSLVNSVRDAKTAAYDLGEDADPSLTQIRELTQTYVSAQSFGKLLNYVALGLGLLAAAIGFFWIWLKLQETRLTTAQIEESIMHLMTDLISISDGNLALRSRVAENITGSIADSLNLTVSRLNRTMSEVRDSSQTVRQGAEQMTSDAAMILESVRDQSSKIKDTSSSVNSISDSVQAIAFAAEQSSDVATQQQDATQQGRDAVAAVIASMASIREQIQDTSKRIKRLGESAQEIDEIIELISDTTEQTNVLAMNASIQAAAAGEAGRGFRAVATEVQRLAERSDQSLKRIVTLIRSMQADTQNAVSAMERSTQEVVSGAQTTSKAGEALNRIEEVSSELNNLIAAITEATQQQTSEAKVITDRMSEILQISTSTARGVEQTTTGIQTIAGLAEELDDAMGQFKLQ